MIQVICDKCRKDCGLNAYALTVEVINNPCPVHIFDVGDLKITCDHTKMRMIVCQNCYRSFGFPNIHKAVREKKLTWREPKGEIADCEQPKITPNTEAALEKMGEKAHGEE